MKSLQAGALLTAGALAFWGQSANAESTNLTIGAINYAHEFRLQKLSEQFMLENPEIKLNWVILEENVLRQRVTADIAMHSDQFDIVEIGIYEAPIWAKRGWLLPLAEFGKDYDVEDLLPKIRAGLSYKGQLYATPFTGTSSFTLYRNDLFEKAGLTMPANPTWDFIFAAARKINDKAAGVYGICLRSKAGWGENMALISVMANSYGARWFDEQWRPQFNQPEWKRAITDYVQILQDAGAPGLASNGATENAVLFSSGKCGIWIDDTNFASLATDPKASKVYDKVGFALAPNTGVGKNASWLWSWGFAVPADSRKAAAARKFILWATSKSYRELVASKEGWANVPPGTRMSLYVNQQYMLAAPFAGLVVSSIDQADPDHPAVKPVPYVGVQFPSIPEYPSIGTQVGQIFAAAATGALGVDDALDQAQRATSRIMERGGYYK